LGRDESFGFIVLKFMILDKLVNKKICILGYGIENQALVKFLISKKIKTSITICDARKTFGKKNIITKFTGLPRQPASRLPRNDTRVSWRLGKGYDKNLGEFDIIFRIAGYPLFTPEIRKARQAGVEIFSPTKLFFEFCPTKNIIGITGTKGKGTTATIIYDILEQAGKRVFFGGNIGTPVFSFFNKIKKDDWVVLELSSFQLEDMRTSPYIAVITNFSREHLKSVDPNNPNHHKTVAGYRKAKANIFRWQNKSDMAIINKKLVISNWKLGEGRKIYFTKSNLESKLVGEHNKENIAAAMQVAKIAGIKEDIIKKTVKNFKGLEHRLENVRKIKGVQFYNDSFATTPESAIIALKSFKQGIILLAGGADKGSSLKELAKEIKKRVKYLILFNGKATIKIRKELIKLNYPSDKMQFVYNMEDAVRIAKDNSKSGDTVLLSAACASFGIFKNYKERGKLFKKEVRKIA